MLLESANAVNMIFSYGQNTAANIVTDQLQILKIQLNHHRLEAGGFGLAAESSLKLTNLEVIALLSFF